MPRQSTNTLNQAQMLARFWGDSGRSSHNNRAPRTNLDVFTALNYKYGRALLEQADYLAQKIDTDGNIPSNNFGAWGNTTPLRNYFAYSTSPTSYWGSSNDEYGLTAGALSMLPDIIRQLADLALGDTTDCEALRVADRKVKQAELLLNQQKAIVKSLNTEVANYKKIIDENGIEMPKECVSCGAHKPSPISIFHKSPIAKCGVSKYANDFYLNSKGEWIKCENPIEGESYEYPEGTDFKYDIDNDDWLYCSKGDGEDGLCGDCWKPMGRCVNPHPRNSVCIPCGKNDTETPTGYRLEYRFHTPKCYFCQTAIASKNPCSVWNKGKYLLNPVIEQLLKQTASPMEIRKGLPRCLRIADVLEVHNDAMKLVYIQGETIDGGGDTTHFDVAETLTRRIVA